MSITDDIDVLTTAHHPSDWTDLDTRAVDTVRVLAADAVQKVGNGHPGTAMSLAPLAYTLFQRTMRHDPTDTHWIGRDRFVLSCGHSSLTLYIQLYLGGFGLELADIEALRTFRSKTPGHPEFRHTDGVEITTGPLGQGLASAVGMAMASRRERGLFDPEPALGESPFDHFIYVIASDGDIEEGITSEASSLAGTQQLGNLILFYDDNKISIEHDTDIALSEDVAKRYEAYGWHVQVVEGGENVTAIEEAIEAAKDVTDKPSIICLRTIIGFPAPDYATPEEALVGAEAFIERFKDGGRRSLHKGAWRETEVHEEILRVRGQDAPERVTIHRTCHGPVICGDHAGAAPSRWPRRSSPGASTASTACHGCCAPGRRPSSTRRRAAGR